MLARMWDPYTNIWYAPEEAFDFDLSVKWLKARLKNALASEGLRKLSAACGQAINPGLGLFLVGD